MTLALSLPEMPDKLIAAFLAAGALGMLIAAARTDSKWERLFAWGIGAFAIWASYFFAMKGSNLTDSYHTYIFLVLMTLSLGSLAFAWARAGDVRQRMAAAALALFIARAWWESVLAVSCGNLVGFDCRGGLASKHFPEWLVFVIFLAALLLFMRAWRIASDSPPSRWIVLGFAGYLLFDTYASMRAAFSDAVPGSRLTFLIQLIGYGGAFAAWIMAARDGARRATMIFGAALALFVVPGVWNAVRELVA